MEARQSTARRVGVVDVALGNVGSVCNMLRKVGAVPVRLATPPRSLDGLPLLLPGVGAYDEGMRRLRESGWRDVLVELPGDAHILGICLGMQLLGNGSEEGTAVGLGRIGINFRRFIGVPRVPHMGWNRVLPGRDRLFEDTAEDRRFYFAHSYYAVCDDPDDVIGETVYGVRFPSAVRRGGTVGLQFHPEKSHRFGMTLLREWVDAACS